MAIIDLKTNLKDVYTTSKPYITHPIPKTESEANRYSGVLGKINAKKDDVIRITKFLTDVKNSTNFIATNVGLQRMNPLTEVGESLRVYSPSTTLLQIGASGVGASLHRHGLNPFDTITYSSVKEREMQVNDVTDTRLYKIGQNLFINDDDVIQSYNGGSQSVYGIGRTEILRTVNTNYEGGITKKITVDRLPTSYEYVKDEISKDNLLQITKDIIHNDGDTFIGSNGTEFVRYDDLNENSVTRNSSDFSMSLKERLNIEERTDGSYPLDFRASLPNLINPETGRPYKESYKDYNLEKRVGLGNADLTVGRLPIYYSDSPLGNSDKTKIFDTRVDRNNVIRPSKEYLFDQTRDLIRFRIELIDTDNPSFGQYIVLRSTITGYTVNYSAQWNSQIYVGRGDKFHTYSSTDSSISFNFTCYAKSKDEMKIMYQKMNTLIGGALYPSYKKNKMRGSMIRITVGDLLENQPAIVTNFTLNVPDETSWEIALDTQNDTTFNNGVSLNDYTLPFMLTGNISIIPIYNFLPQKSLSNSFFILPNENLKEGTSNLKWISGDLRKLETSIQKNVTANSQEYDAKYRKNLSDTIEISTTNVNQTSVEKSIQYQEFNA